MNVHPGRPLIAKPRRNWPITIVLVLTIVVVAMLAIGTPAVIQSSNTGRQLKDSSDLQGCRSAANAAVTDARNDLDQAGVVLNQRRVDNEKLQNQFLEAITNGDRDGILGLRPRFSMARHALDRAQATVDGAAKRLDRANSDYQSAVKLSTSDPVKFLRTCQEDGS